MPSTEAEAILVEHDEDLELALAGGREYVQVKTRSDPLAWGDLEGTMERFASLREEHLQGRRDGRASFAVISNSAPNGPLLSRISGDAWPKDVCVRWPDGSRGSAEVSLPPSWPDLEQAFAWCTDKAAQVTFSALDPATLVWKLAGCMQSAAAGYRDHQFVEADLPNLFEQFLVQLQDFPKPPLPYRPLVDEPDLDTSARVRLVVGLSGAGKTSWASEAALHSEATFAYFDIGDLPGSAVASSLAREIAGRLPLTPSEEGSGLLLSGSGLETLRGVDARLEEAGVSPLVVLDNIHRIEVSAVRGIIEAAPNSRFVMIGQPWPDQGLLEAHLQIEVEKLRGWNRDVIVAEFKSQGCTIDASSATRILSLTAGVPLYVRGSASATRRAYGGQTSEFCAAVENETHLECTSQEAVLSETFRNLSDPASLAASILSLATVPLSQEEASTLVGAEIASPKEVAKAIRELVGNGVVETFYGGQLKLHDAYRLTARSHATLSDDLWRRCRESLRDFFAESLRTNRDIGRLGSWMRLLPQTGDTAVLVDLATTELFHEFGDPSDLKDILEAAATAVDLTLDDRFWALDALIFWDSQSDDWSSIDDRLDRMAQLVADGELGITEQRALEVKRMLASGHRRDEAGIVDSFQRAHALGADDETFVLILRYNHARALLMAKMYGEAGDVVGGLAQDYFDLLGLDPVDVVGKNPKDIWPIVAGVSNAIEKLKRLGDCLWMLAVVAREQDDESGLSSLHAMKFYVMSGAYRSAVRVGQDVVDEFVGRSDPRGARSVLEGHLLPIVTGADLLDLLIPVRAQYSVVLAYCGEIVAARSEMGLLEAYDLTDAQKRELENQKSLIDDIAHRIAPH